MYTIDATLRVFSPRASISENTVIPVSAMPRSHRLNGILLSVYHNVDQRITSIMIQIFQTKNYWLVRCKIQYTETEAVYSSIQSESRRRGEEERNDGQGSPRISLWALIYLAVYFPNATWVKILSFIPFWTPTLMLVRIALDAVAWWEIALTIVLMLVTILACAWFSARLYRFGVLMYGQRPGPGQLVKMVRMK